MVYNIQDPNSFQRDFAYSKPKYWRAVDLNKINSIASLNLN
jgi:hypothetical protein